MNFVGSQAHVVTALAPDADRYDTNPASDIFNMGKFAHVCFVLAEGAGGTGTVKIQVEACVDAAATGGGTAIAFKYKVMSTIDTWGALTESASTGYTTTAGADKMVAVEVDAADLPAGKPFVRLQLTEVVNSPCDAGIIAILTEQSYPQSIPVTAIA